MSWWWLVVLLVSLAALALAIAGVALRSRGLAGRRGHRGRRGGSGPTGSGVAAWSIGRTAVAGATVIFPFGAADNNAMVLAPGGTRSVAYPIDSSDPMVAGILDNGAWAEIGTGVAHDLQVVPPDSSA